MGYSLEIVEMREIGLSECHVKGNNAFCVSAIVVYTSRESNFSEEFKKILK